jgi:hypothetical protein
MMTRATFSFIPSSPCIFWNRDFPEPKGGTECDMMPRDNLPQGEAAIVLLTDMAWLSQKLYMRPAQDTAGQ